MEGGGVEFFANFGSTVVSNGLSVEVAGVNEIISGP